MANGISFLVMTNQIELLDRPEGRIAYTVEGPADGPLVVLVPGMGDLRGTWRDLVTPLVAAGYRTAVTDLRGHGDSDTTFRLHGDLATGSDVIALVEHLGGPAVLIGSSMGAAAVAWVAAERPDLVAGLVLSGPLLRNPPTSSPLLEHVLHTAYRGMFVRPWGAALWASYYRSPLSRGRREGDQIRCGYHGLAFDSGGRCVDSPFANPLPAHAAVPTLEVVVRHGALWFWPGEPSLADPGAIPDFAFVEADGTVPGRTWMVANYELVTDNLMDLSHAEFLHVETFGTNGALFGGEHKAAHLRRGAGSERLRQRRVLGVDGHDLPGLRDALHELAADDQRLLVRQSERAPRLERCERRAESHGSGDAVDQERETEQSSL